MDEMTADDVRSESMPLAPREPRYESARRDGATVHVEREGESREELAVRLLDISHGGAMLAADRCVPFEQAIRLGIDVLEPASPLSIAATVRWTRPVGEGGWTLGCAFQSKLTDETLDRLAKAGYANRRRDARSELPLGARASWELGKQDIPVLLHDVSEGGFSIISPELGGDGRKLLLITRLADGTPIEIGATIRWHVETDDGCRIGCSFSTLADYELLLFAGGVEYPDAGHTLDGCMSRRCTLD